MNTPASTLPSHATSLAEQSGGKVDRIALARALFVELDRVYKDFSHRQFESILESWRRFAGFLGKRIRVVIEGRSVDGQAIDVDANGALLVRTDEGFTEALPAGEVLVVR